MTHSSEISTLAISMCLQIKLLLSISLGLHDAQQLLQLVESFLYLDAVCACNAMRAMFITYKLARSLVLLCPQHVSSG